MTHELVTSRDMEALVETGVAEAGDGPAGVKRGRVKDLACSLLIKVHQHKRFISVIDFY